MLLAVMQNGLVLFKLILILLEVYKQIFLPTTLEEKSGSPCGDSKLLASRSTYNVCFLYQICKATKFFLARHSPK